MRSTTLPEMVGREVANDMGSGLAGGGDRWYDSRPVGSVSKLRRTVAEFEPQLEEEVVLLCQVLPCWQGSSQLTLCLQVGGERKEERREGSEGRGGDIEGKGEGGREEGRREREESIIISGWEYGPAAEATDPPAGWDCGGLCTAWKPFAGHVGAPPRWPVCVCKREGVFGNVPDRDPGAGGV